MNKKYEASRNGKASYCEVYGREKVISVIHRFLPLTLRHVNYVQ